MKQSPPSFLGKCHSEESKEKMRQFHLGKRGDKTPHWKGGIINKVHGYVMVFSPDHPFAIKGGYVYQHRLVMEGHLGRTLLPTEIVHHINGNRKDNRIENLMRCSSQKEHTEYHNFGRKKHYA